MRRDHERFAALGATLAVVGQGTPHQSADFVRALDLPYPVLADPERVAFRAFGLVEGGLGAFANPGAAWAVLRAVGGGAGGGPVVGSVRQLPGAFVVDRGGILRFAKPARHAADTASTDELVAAIAATPDDRPPA